MVLFLLRTLIFLVSAFVGLIAADIILDGFTIHWSNWWGVVLCVVIFAVLQSVLSPWITKVARRNAPALLGGVGIISTLIALVIVVLIPGGGLAIGQPVLLSWILAPVIVWAVTALATVLLPMVLIRDRVKGAQSRKSDD